MATLPMYDMSGKEVGKYEIDSAVISATINKQLLHDVIVMYQANLRQGSKKTKTRAQVAGANKKMYRQKGTGNARAGSRRSGIRRGGGHIHAVGNRDFSYRLPRKAVRIATRMAVASKVNSGQVVVVDDLKCEEVKTKTMVGLLDGIGRVKSTLVATDGHCPNVYLSGRNISGVTVMAADDLNAYAVLKVRRIVFSKSALESLKVKARQAAEAKVEAKAAATASVATASA